MPEVSTKEQTGIPDVKAEAGGAGVSIGSVYSQEVTFKSLKPTIVGTGLQAANFGWSLKDEMVDMSAKRLIAIIGVPKNTRLLEGDMVVNVKTKHWLTQGDVGSSEPKPFVIGLPGH
jgi:hypothetical protein